MALPSTDLPRRRLGWTDMDVSIQGFGASSLGSVFRETNDDESREVVRYAVENGVNYIDTAPWYGHGKSESVLGTVLPHLPRQSFYVATKVGRYEREVPKMFDFTAERTIRSVDESLARLGLSYVDIIQVHDVEFVENIDIIINETLPALQKVKESGKARYIGITGYPLSVLAEIIERSTVKIDTVLSYCRYSMNDTALVEYIPYFNDRRVAVINASPISMGLLSDRGPPEWHPAADEIRMACATASSFARSEGVDISRLALHFSLENADIATTLVSTASVKNMKQNIAAAVEQLSEKEMSVQKQIIENFLTPISLKHWEGIEVKKYWQSMAHLSPCVSRALRNGCMIDSSGNTN